MEAFIDFHYVLSSCNKYFINEMCIIIFSKETREKIYFIHSTFRFPELMLDYKSNITYNYTKKNCHGLDYNLGNMHWSEFKQFIEPILCCERIFLRGSMKCKIIINSLKYMFGKHPPVYNITTEIAKMLADLGVKGDGKNLPGYISYNNIKLMYPKNRLYCNMHNSDKTMMDKCIVGQCDSTFNWFIDKYYSDVYKKQLILL